MRVTVHGETDLAIDRFDSPDLEVESLDPEAGYGALQIFATSMALCTFSALAAYAEIIAAPMDNIAMRVRWDYTDRPLRIANIGMEITWPDVPESRIEAAVRAAAHCTLHNTLSHPPEVVTRVHRIANPER